MSMLNLLHQKYHALVLDKLFSEILNGTVWALAAKLIAISLWLVASAVIAKFYGAKALGIVAIIQVFLQLAAILTSLGTNTSIIRLIPEHLTKYSPTSAYRIYRKTQFMVMGFALATSALFYSSSSIIADKILNKPSLTFYFALAAFFIIFRTLMLLNTNAVRGLKLIRSFALMKIMPQGFNLMLLTVLSLVTSSMHVPVYALLGGYTLTGITGWTIMEFEFKKRMQPRDRILPMPVKRILSISLPMLTTATMTFTINHTGVIFLGIFRPEVEVGYYSVAVKLATITAYILEAVNAMVAPKFSELFHSDRIDELFHIAKKSAKLIFWVSTPIFLVFLCLGKPILRIGYGPEFVMAYYALILLVTGKFVHAISGATGLFMNMTGHQKLLRNIIFVAAMTNISLNLLLTPVYGIYGAAIAAMLSLIGWNIVTLCFIKKNFGKTTGYFPVLAK